MSLNSLIRACGTNRPPGVKSKLYFTLKGELSAFPQTQYAITVAAMGDPVAGDKKRLGEAFDFSGAPTDFGYFREVDILVDTGNLRNTIEGELGGQGVRQRLDFFIVGMEAEALEWGDDLVANSGCLIPLVPLKTGLYAVMGDLENPCQVEAGEGGSGGERVGHQYTLYSNTGFMPYLYDVDALGLDLIPNV